MTTTYKITVKTSDKTPNAGTNSRVEVQLVGEDGETSEWIFLNKFLWNDFERGQEDNYTVKSKLVGLPVVVRFKLLNLLPDDWFCDTVTIETGNLRAEFPVYEWVYDRIEVGRGTAQLPQKETNAILKKLRNDEIAENKKRFLWTPKATSADELGWGFPRYVRGTTRGELPRIFHRSEVREQHILAQSLSGVMNQLMQQLHAAMFSIDDLNDYHKLYDLTKLKRENPLYLEDWITDESFGRQTLNGVNPHCFKRCAAIPKGCDITGDDVNEVLGGGKTLEGEMEAGKIYISDYLNLFDGVPRRKHHAQKTPLVCPECVALFYVNDAGKFLPLAVQLVAGSRDHVFTPKDRHEDWLLAKMYFRCAQSNDHEWITHFLNTHTVMEPFAVAMFRCLPRSHPIHKLLRPHLRTLLVINLDARNGLLPDSAPPAVAIATEAIAMTRRGYTKFSLKDLNIPKLLKKLGTDDPDLLPNYFYRDDALAHWKVMEKFVSGVIGHYYKRNADVANDIELQDWATDVGEEGLGWQDGNKRGMPKKLNTIKKLIKLCMTLIFTSSVQHAAVNFGQFENYKFTPNSPLAMRLPPHRKGEANVQRILDSLPDVVMASTVVSVVFALSEFSPNEIYLGNFPQKLFTDPEVVALQSAYKRDLEDLELSIKARNMEAERSYIYLLPSRVPNSIAI